MQQPPPSRPDPTSLPPQCGCKKPAKHWVTKKPGVNHGRWFWNCGQSKCGFFKWDDKTAPCRTLTAPVAKEIHPSPAKPPAKPPDKRPHLQTADIIFRLESSTSISIQLVENGVLVPQVRALPHVTWDQKTARWLIPAHYETYTEAVRRLAGTASSVRTKVTLLPSAVVQSIKDADENYGSKENWRQTNSRIRTSLLGTRLWDAMKDFQRVGVEKGILHRGRLLLGDEMGLGKTIQALGITLAYQETWPVLVICPSSLRLTWKAEIQRWLLLADDEIYVCLTGQAVNSILERRAPKRVASTAPMPAAKKCITSVAPDFSSLRVMPMMDASQRNNDIVRESYGESRRLQFKFYVVSYDLAAKFIAVLKSAEFKFIICDESHYLKNKATKRTETLIPLLQSTPHLLLLSGTPAFSKPIELYTQISAIRPGLFEDYHEFGVRYCGAFKSAFGWDYSGSSNLTELNAILERSIMLRRLKTDVGIQLPAKVRQAVYVETAVKAKRWMDKTNADLSALARIKGSGQQSDQKTIQQLRRSMLLEMYVETGKAKISQVKDYLSHLFDSDKGGDRKMLIFAYHIEMIDSIEAATKAHNRQYIRIDGNTDQSVRQALCDTFQRNSKVQVAILSLAAASVGLTLSAANLVIFAELSWTPSQLLQAEDRAHRIGRIGSLDVKYILGMDTLDNHLWPLLKKKLKVIGETLDGSQTKVNIDETQTSHASFQNRQKQQDLVNILDEMANSIIE